MRNFIVRAFLSAAILLCSFSTIVITERAQIAKATDTATFYSSVTGNSTSWAGEVRRTFQEPWGFWSDIISGNGTYMYYIGEYSNARMSPVYSCATTDKWETNGRSFFNYDLTALPDESYFNGGYFDIWITSTVDFINNNPSYALYEFSPSSDSLMSLDDYNYNNIGLVPLTYSKHLSDMTEDSLNRWYFTAYGLSRLNYQFNQDKLIHLAMLNSYDATYTSPSWADPGHFYFDFDPTPNLPSVTLNYSATSEVPSVVTNNVTYNNNNYNFYGTLNTANCSIRGFEIGDTYYDGNAIFNPNLKLDEMNNGGNETATFWHGETGIYSLSSNLLTANTTYFYRAFAKKIGQDGIWIIGYGATENFTSSAGSNLGDPVVTTDSVYYLDGVLNATGTIVSSPTAILERGIRMGLSRTTMSTLTFDTLPYPLGWFNFSVPISQAGGVPYTAGTHLFVQLYARNSSGTGYGEIVDYIVPISNLGVTGIYVTNNGVTPINNTALISATITNPSNTLIERIGFAWGLTAATENAENLPLNAYPTTISKNLTELSSTTVYWFKCGVYAARQWIWSEPTSFTTGLALPSPFGGSPIVLTLSATNIGSNFFTANGNLVSVGEVIGSYVSNLGFAYSFDRNVPVENWGKINHTGNFSAASYTETISLSRSNVQVFVSFYAQNQFGVSFGNIVPVSLTGSGSPTTTPTTPAVPTNPVTAPISNWILWLAQVQGLDNPFGHWAFLIEAMLVVGLIFFIPVIAFVLKNEMSIAKIWTWVALTAEVVTAGAFIFTGWLGIWPLIFLGCAVIVVIIIIIAIFASKGGGGS